jgi:hypothetical protein
MNVYSNILVVAFALGALVATARAEDPPRMPDGKPDFSGIYTQPATVNASGPRGNLIFNADKMAPVKPGAEGLLYEARNGDPRHDEPRAMCLPAGFLDGMLYILPIQIVRPTVARTEKGSSPRTTATQSGSGKATRW